MATNIRFFTVFIYKDVRSKKESPSFLKLIQEMMAYYRNPKAHLDATYYIEIVTNNVPNIRIFLARKSGQFADYCYLPLIKDRDTWDKAGRFDFTAFAYAAGGALINVMEISAFNDFALGDLSDNSLNRGFLNRINGSNFTIKYPNIPVM